MKKILLLLVMILALNFSFAQNTFKDISTSPYKDAINSLLQKWIINWYSDWTFRPKNNITRAELVKIFFEAKK